MKGEKFSFACPICGHKTDYPLKKLVKGAVLTCSFCRLRLTLQGHMLEDVRKGVKKLRRKLRGRDSPKGDLTVN